jgi:hypothetical protein
VALIRKKAHSVLPNSECLNSTNKNKGSGKLLSFLIKEETVSTITCNLSALTVMAFQIKTLSNPEVNRNNSETQSSNKPFISYAANWIISKITPCYIEQSYNCQA